MGMLAYAAAMNPAVARHPHARSRTRLTRILRSALALVALACLPALLLGLTACAATCHRNEDLPAVIYRDGLTVGDQYMTTEVGDAYLDFPSGRRFRLMHQLGSVPGLIVPYVSFSAHPLDDRTGFTVSPGNQTVVRAVTATYIEVENDTCTDFYLRVVASVADDVPDAGG